MGRRKIGEVMLEVRNISLRFGGVKALTDISFDVREHEIRAIDRKSTRLNSSHSSPSRMPSSA